MRTIKILIVLGLVTGLAACVPVVSVHPLFNEGEEVFEPALVGTWKGQGDFKENVMSFRKSADKTYELTFPNPKGRERLKYDAHLIKLEQHLFLDLTLNALELNSHKYDFQEFLGFLPCHVFFKIEIEGKVLHLAYLDDEWMRKMTDRGEDSVGHELLGEQKDGIVLTAPTRDLQKLVLKYAQDEKAFADTGEWRRQK